MTDPVDIKVGELWRYVGRADGYCRVHQILTSEPHEVIASCGKFSWIGKPLAFRKEFHQLSK